MNEADRILSLIRKRAQRKRDALCVDCESPLLLDEVAIGTCSPCRQKRREVANALEELETGNGQSDT